MGRASNSMPYTVPIQEKAETTSSIASLTEIAAGNPFSLFSTALLYRMFEYQKMLGDEIQKRMLEELSKEQKGSAIGQVLPIEEKVTFGGRDSAPASNKRQRDLATLTFDPLKEMSKKMRLNSSLPTQDSSYQVSPALLSESVSAAYESADAAPQSADAAPETADAVPKPESSFVTRPIPLISDSGKRRELKRQRPVSPLQIGNSEGPFSMIPSADKCKIKKYLKKVSQFPKVWKKRNEEGQPIFSSYDLFKSLMDWLKKYKHISSGDHTDQIKMKYLVHILIQSLKNCVASEATTKHVKVYENVLLIADELNQKFLTYWKKNWKRDLKVGMSDPNLSPPFSTPSSTPSSTSDSEKERELKRPVPGSPQVEDSNDPFFLISPEDKLLIEKYLNLILTKYPERIDKKRKKNKKGKTQFSCSNLFGQLMNWLKSKSTVDHEYEIKMKYMLHFLIQILKKIISNPNTKNGKVYESVLLVANELNQTLPIYLEEYRKTRLVVPMEPSIPRPSTVLSPLSPFARPLTIVDEFPDGKEERVQLPFERWSPSLFPHLARESVQVAPGNSALSFEDDVVGFEDVMSSHGNSLDPLNCNRVANATSEIEHGLGEDVLPISSELKLADFEEDDWMTASLPTSFSGSPSFIRTTTSADAEPIPEHATVPAPLSSSSEAFNGIGAQSVSLELHKLPPLPTLVSLPALRR